MYNTNILSIHEYKYILKYKAFYVCSDSALSM